MPQVVRLGDVCTGHDCFPPRSNSSGSPNVYVNDRAAHRVGDSWNDHACTHPDMPHGVHGSVQASGSSSVYVNGMSLARVGDSIACGSKNASGSSNVYAG